MSNYTVVTNFGAKDGLASGNPAKLVLGSQFTTEFSNIAAAIASKIDGTVVFAPDGNATQPSYGFTNNAGTGMYNAAGVIGFATSGLQRFGIAGAGGVTVFAPTSGTAFTVNGAVSVNGSGSNAVLNMTGSGAFSSVITLGNSGGGLSELSFPSTLTLLASGGGNPILDFTSTGGTYSSLLNLRGLGGGSGVIDTPGAGSLIIKNNGTTIATLISGVQVGAPTGGDKGAGTVNATNLYVNGVAVSAGSATLVVTKAALTARPSNATLSNDPDLVIAIPGAGTYAIEAVVTHYNASPTQGISFNLNYSGTFTTNSSVFSSVNTPTPTSVATLITGTVTTSLDSGNTGSSVSAPSVSLINATLVATGAGNIGFAWAQNTSNASATNVGAGSYMTATKIA